MAFLPQRALTYMVMSGSTTGPVTCLAALTTAMWSQSVEGDRYMPSASMCMAHSANVTVRRSWVVLFLLVSMMSVHTLTSMPGHNNAKSVNIGAVCLLAYSSRSQSCISCHGRPCLLSSSMNGSGSNSSTLCTPGLFHSPRANIRAPMHAGTPVV